MADRSKIIFVNTDGDYEETAFADSLSFTSYKTANYELTDLLLGDVTNKMIKSDGSRPFTANQSHGGFKITSLAEATTGTDAVNLGQLTSTATGKGASYIGLEDSGGYTAATTVEGAIAELYQSVGYKMYTVGTGGVSKGDMLYLTANNTVTKMPIGAGNRAVGLAITTQIAGAMVAVQRADFVHTGVLTGATFGTRYFWNGTALTTTQPTAAGSYVWSAGVAINATDLLSDVEFIKKNS